MDMNEFLEKYTTSREHTDCEKWDGLRGVFGEDGLLPMWVADMEFRACEAVTEALAARVRHGVFGYTFLPDSYYEAVSAWEQRFGYRPEREHIRCASGVVPAVYWLVSCFTEPGDAVAILTPVYYPFHDCVRDTGRRLVTCDLRYAAGRFEIDFAAFERSLADSGAKLFILCSPHNPAGRVWRADELDRLLGICRRRGVLVISDEIHQDFVFGASRHIAAPAVSGGRYADGVILVSAASKSFNLAGLNHANIFIPDPGLRARYDDWHRAVRPGGSSIMGQTATEAAYRGGAEWLEGVKEVIWANYRHLRTELERNVPEITVCELEGTYLPMLDMRRLIDIRQGGVQMVHGRPVSGALFDFVQRRCRLAVDYGSWFGENFDGFIRLNLATTPENVRETVSRIVRESERLRRGEGQNM